MDSPSAPTLDSNQLSTILQAFFQNIVTKDDLRNFATKEDILEIQNTEPKDDAGAGNGNSKSKRSLTRLRKQISENQTAIDSLYQEMASNKRVLTNLTSEIKELRQEISSLKTNMTEIRTSVNQMQLDNQVAQTENAEVLHNVEANTRVIGKLAAVVTDLNSRIEQVVTKEEINFLRGEMIERLDGIIRRFEIFEQEQISLKSAMKRMEKIQREEALRNDAQDSTLKMQQEKIKKIEQKISKVG